MNGDREMGRGTYGKVHSEVRLDGCWIMRHQRDTYPVLKTTLRLSMKIHKRSERKAVSSRYS